MAWFGYACALVLAAVFVRAGAAKLARRDGAAASFSALGVPAPDAMARAVPVLELVLAVVLLARPVAGSVAALAVLGAFSAVLARAIATGVTAGCNCFGSATSKPVSGRDLARNGLLAALAIAVLATR